MTKKNILSKLGTEKTRRAKDGTLKHVFEKGGNRKRSQGNPSGWETKNTDLGDNQVPAVVLSGFKKVFYEPYTEEQKEILAQDPKAKIERTVRETKDQIDLYLKDPHKRGTVIVTEKSYNKPAKTGGKKIVSYNGVVSHEAVVMADVNGNCYLVLQERETDTKKGKSENWLPKPDFTKTHLKFNLTGSAGLLPESFDILDLPTKEKKREMMFRILEDTASFNPYIMIDGVRKESPVEVTGHILEELSPNEYKTMLEDESEHVDVKIEGDAIQENVRQRLSSTTEEDEYDNDEFDEEDEF